MSVPSELDWRTLPLSGTSLIEASAGTGKTYNIALLYLRLVLERGLDARQLLVTTFTDAAAQELRARIRQRLLDAEAAMATPTLPDSDLKAFLEELCERDGRTPVLIRVKLALSEIDLAPISTIHGFCKRVLSDYPFDTGVPFILGEIVDEKTLMRECVEDFWRKRFLVDAIDPWDSACVLDAGLDPFAKIVGDVLSVDADAVEIERTEALRAWWVEYCREDHSDFRKMVEVAGAFRNGESSGLRQLLLTLLEATRSGDVGTINWSDLGSRLDPDKLKTAGIKGFQPHLSTWTGILALSEVRHLFANAKGRVRNEAGLDCARFVREQLRTRLQVRGQTTFRQLIDEVHDRLLGSSGAQLATRLQQAWPVALIDEFQDTDARQWAIFDRVWRGTGSDERALILIGDPKQSIYGFRGGDVHSYLSVRNSLPPDRLHSISRNFRSQPNLLRALNGLYARAKTLGFGESGIDYVEVESGTPEKWATSADPQPLQLRQLPFLEPKAARDKAALTSCADDIAALLNDRSAAVSPGDIAVLIDANKRIEVLRELLIARNVPVVGAGRASVMDGDWAQDVQLLLCAMLDPSDEYALRGALATRLLGCTASDLTRLADDVDAWERHLKWFADQQQRWRRMGPLAVIESVIEAQAPRLLAAADGERALTDLRHLGELLQEASAECYGPEELYAWYVGERALSGGGDDATRERQLRIESDTARVQLLTIHASKGLQFPVVFVPMGWRERRYASNGRARYHDERQRLRLDLGTAQLEEREKLANRADLQERLRNLYVALTRAKRRCVVYGFDNVAPESAIKKLTLGALDVLLGAALSHPDDHDGTPLERLTHAVPTLAVTGPCTGSKQCVKQEAPNAIRAAREPAPSARPYLGLYSFTALTRLLPTATVEATRNAEDETDAEATEYPETIDLTPAHPELAKLSKLKGPRFGDAVHGLLEDELIASGPETPKRARFATQAARIRQALDRQSVRLAADGAEQELVALADLLDRTLDTELATDLRLGLLPTTARRPEFEFTFELDQARWWQLHALLNLHGFGDWWPRMQQAQTLRGMMKGFMDLVFEWDGRFHVLDYKTNWLGERLSDYGAASLDAAMQEHHYGLQALIYTVALHRYLANRIAHYDPQRHLGDSWYLFVRAVGLAPDAGVWRERFPQALVDGLDALFNGEELSACA